MARLTAATAVLLLILPLTAEAWEIGINLPLSRLVIGTVVSLIVATGFIFAGQNLGQISRDTGWREQLIRTCLVVLGTVLLGMIRVAMLTKLIWLDKLEMGVKAHRSTVPARI